MIVKITDFYGKPSMKWGLPIGEKRKFSSSVSALQIEKYEKKGYSNAFWTGFKYTIDI